MKPAGRMIADRRCPTRHNNGVTAAVALLLVILAYTERMHSRPTRTLPTVVLPLLACAVALAACGSSTKSKTLAASTPSSASTPPAFGVKFAQCIRKHGVPNYPDPGSGTISGAGINPRSPAFQAAQTECFKLVPGSDPAATNAETAGTERQFLAAAKCMRKHGVPNFPDPTTGVTLGKNLFGSGGPPRGPAGTTATQDGVSFVLPASINIQSPAFEHASSACHVSGLFGVPPGTATG